MAVDDLVQQCPNVVPESVCQPDPTKMQQHIVKGAVTSGRGQGKIIYAEVAWYKYYIQLLQHNLIVILLTAL